jgi:hypothetical protein
MLILKGWDWESYRFLAILGDMYMTLLVSLLFEDELANVRKLLKIEKPGPQWRLYSSDKPQSETSWCCRT